MNSAMPNLKRKCLSLGDKVRIINMVNSGRKKMDVCRQFNLPRSTFFSILKNQDSILKWCDQGRDKSQRIRLSHKPDLDKCLAKWYEQQLADNQPVNEEILAQKADELAKILGHEPCTRVWVKCFIDRNGVTFDSDQPGDFIKKELVENPVVHLNSMPLQQRISLSQPPTPTLKSQPLSPTKLKVTRQSTAKPQQQNSKEESKTPPIDEAICLRWKTHHSNMQTALPSLLSKEQYCDVTLVAEGKTLKCHKVILSSCSPYFDQVFENIMPYQHPVIFMKDIPFRILKILCDFMYAGEVNILQSDLELLLDAAGSLKIKGLEPQIDSESTNIPTVKANEERVKEPASKKIPYRQSSSEKKNSPPSGDMIDPLDLLKPIYEEAAVPDNVPTLKRNDQTRRSSAKRVRKRKHIEDDHEPSPPIFRTRKGTRSRPNVRVPRYFNASFDNSSTEKNPIENEQSQPSAEASFMDPFMDILEEIKTEPLDIEDGEISYSEEIFDDTSEPLTENVEPEDVDSPFTKRAKTSHIPCVQPKLIVTKQEDDAPDPLGVEVNDDRLGSVEKSNQAVSTAQSETLNITDESTLNQEEMADSQEDVTNEEEIADSQEDVANQQEITDSHEVDQEEIAGSQEDVVSGVMLVIEHHKNIDDNISNHEEMEDSGPALEMRLHHKTTDDSISNHEEMVDSQEDCISSNNAEENVIEMNTLSTIEMGEPKAVQITPELVVNETSTQIITDTVDENR